MQDSVRHVPRRLVALCHLLKMSFKSYRPKLYCYLIDSNFKLQPDGSIRLRTLPQKGKVSISTSFFKDVRAVLADFHDSNVVRMIHVWIFLMCGCYSKRAQSSDRPCHAFQRWTAMTLCTTTSSLRKHAGAVMHLCEAFLTMYPRASGRCYP